MTHRKTLMAESYPSKGRGLDPVTLLYLFIALHVGIFMEEPSPHFLKWN